jgi:hypothetical protein
VPASKSLVRLKAMAPAWPKIRHSPCARDRFGGVLAADRLARDDVAADIIERHGHEVGNLGHPSASSQAPQLRDRCCISSFFFGEYCRRWRAS